MKNSLKISVWQGSLLEAQVDLIVSPANSYGLMGGGVAGVIRRFAGPEVEDEARLHAPIPVGKAVFTTGGRSKFNGIIHAPTMPDPAMRIPVENVALATQAALELADSMGFLSVAFPGMGTGIGKVSPQQAACVMIGAIRKFNPRSLQFIVLVDIDVAMIQAWEACL